MATVRIVYDKECPVCDAWCSATSKANPTIEVELVDARQDSALMRKITARGLDIDEGMVVERDGELFYADEAIYQLTVLTPTRGAMNRLNHLLFGSAENARLWYPPFRAMRNVFLKMLRRTRINNLHAPGRERF